MIQSNEIQKRKIKHIFCRGSGEIQKETEALMRYCVPMTVSELQVE